MPTYNVEIQVSTADLHERALTSEEYRQEELKERLAIEYHIHQLFANNEQLEDYELTDCIRLLDSLLVSS